jgi:hypothetical protein
MAPYLLLGFLIAGILKVYVPKEKYIGHIAKPNFSAHIYTRQITAQLQLDITRHNSQYVPIGIDKTTSVHDRFLIIDSAVYHVGASLKDLGKKLFAFSKMEIKPVELLRSLK